jgi:cyclohexyl-isocyanide hydratase
MAKTKTSVRAGERLNLGGILFPNLDQADFTGPFEVLSCIPNSAFYVLAKTKQPVRDVKGLALIPQRTFAQCPQLDLLLVPGGAGVNAVMEDETVLSFVRRQAPKAKLVLSVCTGALVCGAAGLLLGRKATTHWASHHLLKHFGATAVHERVVRDGNLMTCAGVTAGLDGALRAVSLLRGERAAQAIQLHLEYAPEPPFTTGSPATAPAALVRARRAALRDLLHERSIIVRRVAKKLGLKVHGG